MPDSKAACAGTFLKKEEMKRIFSLAASAEEAMLKNRREGAILCEVRHIFLLHLFCAAMKAGTPSSQAEDVFAVCGSLNFDGHRTFQGG